MILRPSGRFTEGSPPLLLLENKAAYGGFSLIEVVVALTVAAVLCLAFLSSQSTSVEVGGYADEYWEQVDMAHELMAEGRFAEVGRLAGDIQRSGHPDQSWSVEVEQSVWPAADDPDYALAEVERETVTTNVGKSHMSWVRLHNPEN